MNDRRHVTIRSSRPLTLGEAIGAFLEAARRDLGREPWFVRLDYHSGRSGPVVRHELIFN